MSHIWQNPHNVKHRVNSNVSYGLQLVMIYQHWFISCNKCSTLIQGIIENVRWGEREFVELSVLYD